MNDEFLYRLRKDPPPQFAARLKAQLDGQARSFFFGSRSSLIRLLAAALLIGNAALAIALLATWKVPGGIAAVFGIDDKVPREILAPPPVVITDGKVPDANTTVENLESQPAARRDRDDVAASGQEASSQAGQIVAGPPATTASGMARGVQSRRTYVSIVRSSTTAALTNLAVDKASVKSKITDVSAARVIDALCNGVDNHQPDIAIATRRITAAELATCNRRGIGLVEAQLGYQALVVTDGAMGRSFKLTPRDLYLALAKQIPDPADPRQLIDNPHRTWDQVNPLLEPQRIGVRGPRLDTVSGEALAGLVLETGCDTYAWIAALKETDARRYERICHSLRDDGAYVEVSQVETLIQALWTEPHLIGIVDYPFHRRNRDMLGGSLMAGVEPTLENITAGTYKTSRPLYLYVNSAAARSTPDARHFLQQSLAPWSIGRSGSLTREGLIAMDAPRRDAIDADARQLKELKSPTQE